MQLCYDDPLLWDTDATHGGKVSEWHWAYDEAFPLAYAFEYDSLSRVVDSWMYDCEMYYDLFAEQNITYDSNGNLTSMRKIDGEANVEFITYSYNGNQLSGYTYDKNGNVTYDPSLGLTFEWNRLNLLQKVSRGDEVLVKYAYLADGTKLSAIDGAGDGFEYIGSLTFRRSGGSRQLESSAFSQGRIYREGSGQAVSYVPYFYITDHLGSVRAVVDGQSGYVVEENDYYPFGERWDYGINPTGLANRYQYNGKESQDLEFSLPTLDYGARHYSPSTARWLSPDPLAETYYNLSPYAFCGNDPVNYVDPDGRSTWVVAQEDGTYKVVGGNIFDNDLNIYLITFDQNNNPQFGESIGRTTSITTFYDSGDKNCEGRGWMMESIIDPNDKSGQEFIDELIATDPSFIEYVFCAGNRKKYDFKATNGTDSSIPDIDSYRGMPVGEENGKLIYSSARDIGNIMAGYVAGSKGLPWGFVRIGFDSYQIWSYIKHGHFPHREGSSSTNAQKLGWLRGYK